MTLDKLFYIADRIVQRYFLPISITLFIHLIFLGFLIVFEMKNPEKHSQSQIIIDFDNEEIALPELQQNKVEKSELTDNQSEEVKNVEKNLGESNKSFRDYYREAKELLEKGKPKEIFKANDYNDQRWLVKDYSKEIPDVENWNKPNVQKNDNTAQNSKNTYAGNAIIRYDLGGRRAIRLPIPAYKCQGYGKVIIEIVVNPKGNVVSAKISDLDASLNESCLPNTALESARNSRFVPNDKAPANQKGFIYYTFIAQ